MIYIEKFFKKKDRFEAVDKYISSVLDKISIEKPKTIVIDVFNIAIPTVEWQILITSL